LGIRLLVLLGLLVGLGGWLDLVRAQTPGRQQPAFLPQADRAAGTDPPPGKLPAIDRFGDPLPAGARARLGTVRLRNGDSLTAIAYSADGKLLASGSDRVFVWEMPSGKLLHQFKVSEAPQILLFSPDGSRLATSSGIGDKIRELQVWDLKSGIELVRSFNGRVGTHAIAFAPDGNSIATVVNFETVKVCSLATGLAVRRFKTDGRIQVLAFRPDGTLLGLGTQQKAAVLWDLTAGKRLHTFGTGRGEAMAAFAISPDGRVIAFEGVDRMITVFDAVTGRARHRLSGHSQGIASLTFAADSKTLVSGSWDATVRLWDLAGGKERLRLTTAAGGIPFGVLSPDGKTVATGGANSPHAVVLWDAVTGKELNPFPGHKSIISSIALSPDGSLAATSTWVRGEPAIWIWEAATGQPVRTLAGHRGGTRAVTFSPDGRWLASVGWWGDSTVRIWDVATGRELHTLSGHEAGVTCVAFSADGKRLASGDAYLLPGRYQGRVRIWDPVTAT
jgi:WD40 repeat protein